MMNNLPVVVVVSVAVAAAAWYYTIDSTSSKQQPSSSSSSSRHLHSIYVIGDTHGDVECARQWVQRGTGLITTSDPTNNKNNASFLSWTDPTSHLVFMGDYIDKGITSRQTLEYVKSLTETFPNHVTALLGNHEMELLRDRTETSWGGGTAGFFQLSYATVHPAEYLNYLQDNDVHNDSSLNDYDDEMVVEALYNASIEVYGVGAHRSVLVVPNVQLPESILHHVPEQIRMRVMERLQVFQSAYLNAFRTGTPLGTWLERRPVAAIVGDTLLVHGGLSPQVGRLLRQASDVDQLNDIWMEHAVESKLANFLQDTTAGRAVYDLLTYRGNHQLPDACDWLREALPASVTRLAVGHTPDWNVRQHCQGRFWALDASLSRWFRNSGNEYCPGNVAMTSANGHYQCSKKQEHCQGQIVRIPKKRTSNDEDEGEVLTLQ